MKGISDNVSAVHLFEDAQSRRDLENTIKYQVDKKSLGSFYLLLHMSHVTNLLFSGENFLDTLAESIVQSQEK